MNVLTKYPSIIASISVAIGLGFLVMAVSNWYLFGSGVLFVFVGYFVHHHLPEVSQAITDIATEINPPADPTDLAPGASQHSAGPVADNVVKIG
jgi:hypothetical protein